MVIYRRELLRRAGAAAAVAVWRRAAWTETYPSRPVRILVGYAASGEWFHIAVPLSLVGQVGQGASKATAIEVKQPSAARPYPAVTCHLG